MKNSLHCLFTFIESEYHKIIVMSKIDVKKCTEKMYKKHGAVNNSHFKLREYVRYGMIIVTTIII
ncbi:MAG: hypothetical protein FWE83_06175 [Oscillospiraceae bacterium]|nr:hypothetical protein [Oscillospiraceae bacterium]